MKGYFQAISCSLHICFVNLTIWQRRRRWNRHGKLASFQSFSELFQLVHSFKSWEIKLKLKKEYRFLSLERYSKMSSSQDNLKLVIYFHVVVLQGRQRNLLKSVVHVQSCCFAYCVFDFLVCVTVVVSQGPYSSQKKKRCLVLTAR